MSAITTHVLDTARGRPASGVAVLLSFKTDEGEWSLLGRGETNDDGRLSNLLSSSEALREGTYRLTFDTGSYFSSLDQKSFYPEVTVVFIVQDTAQHYHVPLLLSPYGYSTYRGS